MFHFSKLDNLNLLPPQSWLIISIPNRVTSFPITQHTYSRGRSRIFSRGVLGVIPILYRNYIYIAINHIIILINKVHVSTYCAWSYNLHAPVPAATMNYMFAWSLCSLHYHIHCTHFNPIASFLLSKAFKASTSVRQFITWLPIVRLLTIHHVSTSSNHWIHFLP